MPYIALLPLFLQGFGYMVAPLISSFRLPMDAVMQTIGAVEFLTCAIVCVVWYRSGVGFS
jgi:hypothetical protein